jgi:hypothetical protein
MLRNIYIPFLLIVCLSLFNSCDNNRGLGRLDKDQEDRLLKALQLSGQNKMEIINALNEIPDPLIDDYVFLIENMPERDLTSLQSSFISKNIIESDSIFQSTPWSDVVPKEIYLNYVLPYANVNEERVYWRTDLNKRFGDIVDTCNTPGEACVALNNVIWNLINVHYNTKRPKADQNPFESMEANMASCTGLSIMLIDACRSVGVPARFVGTPLWFDVDGNHSWVEVWDKGWHFIGAWESGPLNQTWFEDRAAKATPDNPKYGIFAVSYAKTELIFPTVWDTIQDYVYAENITNRYLYSDNNDIFSTVAIRVFKDNDRVKADVEIRESGKIVEQGKSYGENHDLNDMLSFKLGVEAEYKVIIKYQDNEIIRTLDTKNKKFHKLDVNI